MAARNSIYQLRHMMSRRGEPMKLGRIVGTGPSAVTEYYNLRGLVRGFIAKQLVGGIIYGERHAILLAEDVVASGFPVALAINHKLLVRGRQMNIGSLDDSTYRDKGVLLAYDMKVSG